MIIHHIQLSTTFPYTTLFRSFKNLSPQEKKDRESLHALKCKKMEEEWEQAKDLLKQIEEREALLTTEEPKTEDHVDRKSTRLNSSHITISYAVFCLQKEI